MRAAAARLLRPLLPSLLALLAGCAGLQAPEARFDGPITAQTVDAFLGRVGDGPVRRLVVNSPGGDTLAGMRLGAWVHRAAADVEVDTRCGSACANYVFTAGARKRIRPGAIVYWHGSSEQRDFRERNARWFALERRAAAGEALAGPERDFLERNRALVAASERARAAQRALFRDLGVAEYLTRAGQEPFAVGAAWTYSAEDLKRFGVCDVEAPEGYAGHVQLEALRAAGTPVVRLALDDAILARLAAELAALDYRIRDCP